jgi:hypothetical protein
MIGKISCVPKCILQNKTKLRRDGHRHSCSSSSICFDMPMQWIGPNALSPPPSDVICASRFSEMKFQCANHMIARLLFCRNMDAIDGGAPDLAGKYMSSFVTSNDAML